MVRNKQRLLFVVLFVLAAAVLCAMELDYYIDFSDEEPRFFQQLEWENDIYAMHYEVIIEVQDDNNFIEFRKWITTDYIININLPPGIYRYGVIPYDFLGHAGEISEWTNFEVIRALNPRIETFFPQAFFLDMRTPRVLTLTGENLFDKSEITIRDSFKPLTIERMEFPAENRVNLYFDDELLLPGLYSIHVINPGGLEVTVPGFQVTYRKAMDIFLKAAYTPVIPVYGELIELFDNKSYLPGFTLTFEAISSKRGSFNGGLEVAYSAYLHSPVYSGLIHLMSSIFDDEYNDNWVAFHNFDINISLQKRLFKRLMAFTFRFGTGFSILNNHKDYSAEYFSIHLNLAFTYIIRIYDSFNLETGADFVHHITYNPFGVIKPRLAFVWQF